MPLETRLLTGLAVALAVAYWATPVAIRVADRLQFYDRPSGYKAHGRPTPYLGGAAVVAGFLLAVVALTADWTRTLPLVIGVTVLWVVGTIDDRRHLSPVVRVGVEMAVAALLWHLGLGWELGAGPAVDLAATAFWIVAVVNAFNLFDNMDGAASSMAGVAAAGLALFGVLEGDAWLAVTATALAGACLGFLPHNLLRSPARIFLGDGGSMPVGFAVAALTMMGLTGAAPAWQSLAMGLLFVGIPALDTCLVVISRRRRGVPILAGGRDHLTHRARRKLRTTRTVAATLGSAQALVSALAIVALQGGSQAIALAVTVYVAGVGVAIALLDTRLAPEAGVPPTPLAPQTGAPPPRRRPELAAAALLVPFGLAAGLSPFAAGYYSHGVWVPIGLGLVVVTSAVAVGMPVRLSRPAALALAALAGLGLWSLASALWADSAQQAVTEANRLLVYAVALGALLLGVRSDRAAGGLMAAVAAGGVACAGVIVARMLSSGGPDLFLNGRLDQPLGYINGQASFLLICAWACLAFAERRGSALLAGAGAGGATLLASLVLLSQSRGVVLAAAASVLVVLALVPGRLRRAWALVAIAAGTAAAAPWLLDVFPAAGGSDAPSAVVRSAGLAALLAAVATGLAWAAAVRLGDSRGRPAGTRLAAGGLVALAVTGAVALALSAERILPALERQYDQFVQLEVTSQADAAATGSRLVSGTGNRYDYWRVAWGAFSDRPLTGWGAGNFDGPYFERRATPEDVRQPHSIQLQVLSELGLIGAALLLVLLVAAAWGAWRACRAVSAAPATAGVVAGAVGMVSAWLAHTSVDWIHLLPGVTAAALAGLAILVRQAGVAASGSPARRAPRAPAAVAVALVLAVAGLSLARQAMSEHFHTRAQAALAADPAQALVEADRALRLDPELLSAYYVKAAAFARFDQAGAARRALEEAARREPGDFVTWALLGDLSVRLGQIERARDEYARASRLNPLDPSLQASAREPDRLIGPSEP